MFWVDFATFPLPMNLGAFIVAAAVVWIAGTRIAVYADAIADSTGLGKAFVGLVFLAVATSLPETGMTAASSAFGDAPLAVNTLLGGTVTRTAILAVADATICCGTLTFFSPRPVLMLQGIMLILLLALVLCGAATGEPFSVFGAGMWTLILFVLYGGFLLISQYYEQNEKWWPADLTAEHGVTEQMASGQPMAAVGHPPARELRGLILLFAVASVVIFLAGVTLARVGEAVAGQTGLGGSFVGATLLATSASLPEFSSTIAAIRIGSYSLGISNIFGSNALNVALLLVADIFYPGGSILAGVDPSTVFITALGIVVTCVYLVGLVERGNRTVFHQMGIDSIVVAALYLLSLVVLYFLR